MKPIEDKIILLKEKLRFLTMSPEDYDLILKYMIEGVSSDKIIITEAPSIFRINGKMVSLQVRSVLTSRDVARINNHEAGIVITNYVKKDHFRYAFIK